MEGFSDHFEVLVEDSDCGIEMGPVSVQVASLEKALPSAKNQCWQDPHEGGLGGRSLENLQKNAMDAKWHKEEVRLRRAE